jgi:excisionase family DNA binding protein
MQPTGTPLLVSSAQLAELLQVGDATVKRLADEGRIPFVNLTPRTRRFDPEEVRAALRRMADEMGEERDR